MAGIYLDEISDPKLLALPKYKVGDTMRVKQIKGDWNSFPPATRKVFGASVGRKLKVKEIIWWETVDPDHPYMVTYTFYVAHLVGEPNRRSFLQSIYLEEDEVEPVGKSSGGVAESGLSRSS